MTFEFLTPVGALIALVVLVPVAAFLGVSRRASRVRRGLGLPELSKRLRLVPLSAVLAIAGLLGLAATQPLLERTSTRHVRSDAEVLLVVDVSRSMLARQGLEEPSRLERAKSAGEKFRASLPSVPIGIASMTNRVLPHLFPSTDGDVFDSTLERAIGIERPPPGSSFLAPDQPVATNVTNLASLGGVATQRFYSPAATHRLLVVFTDGESTGVSEAAVGRRLRRARIETVFVQFWDADEQVFTKGAPELQYRPDPAARSILDRLAIATGGSVYDEESVESAISKARGLLGSGPTVAQPHRPDQVALAPYLAAAAFLPLTLLLWRRDR
ncbi:MAG TPA: vWA domain-containing protein [Gaiellaceae bacterium]|nr:vWA domain-containing protein [Gaiellaceae bacterium]